MRTTDNRCCIFPFLYEGERHFTCVSYSFGRKWCATTYNYDEDGQWGKCLGLYRGLWTNVRVRNDSHIDMRINDEKEDIIIAVMTHYKLFQSQLMRRS